MSLLASSFLFIFSKVVFVNEIKQLIYDHFPCLSTAEFVSTTLGDELGKVSISTAKLII